jgi:PEP-CTERM motif
MSRIFFAVVAFLGLIMGGPALADTYTKANFSAGIFGGNANVQSPFSGNGFFQGQTFTGNFVYDDQLVPAGGTGFVNVGVASFPDVAAIPALDLFKFNFGPLVFSAADADEPMAIQYNNGNFNGFFYVNNFVFQGGDYQMVISGGSLSVRLLSQGVPVGNSLVNGYVNIGNAAVTDKTPFVPPVVGPAVPEPGTWAMMVAGFGIAGAAMRRRKVRLTFA